MREVPDFFVWPAGSHVALFTPFRSPRAANKVTALDARQLWALSGRCIQNDNIIYEHLVNGPRARLLQLAKSREALAALTARLLAQRRRRDPS